MTDALKLLDILPPFLLLLFSQVYHTYRLKNAIHQSIFYYEIKCVHCF